MNPREGLAVSIVASVVVIGLILMAYALGGARASYAVCITLFVVGVGGMGWGIYRLQVLRRRDRDG